MTKKARIGIVSSLFAAILGVSAEASALSESALFWNSNANTGDVFYTCTNPQLLYALGTGYNSFGVPICSVRAYNVSIWQTTSGCPSSGVTQTASLRAENVSTIFCSISTSWFNSTGCAATMSTRQNVKTAACVTTGPTAFSVGS